MARTELPDAPYIQNLRNTGYRDGKDPSYPVCPVCGQECEIVYRDRNREIVGCNACVTDQDAWEVPECIER